jgi:thymidylate kinase
MSWTDTHAAALAEVFVTLEASGLDWMVLRNHEGLPQKNTSKDIDLGIRKEDLPRALELVSEALAGKHFDRAFVDYFYGCRSCTFLNIDASEARSIKIDLIDAVPFRGAQVFSVEDLYQNARFRDGRRVPSVTEDAVMLLMKSVLIGSPIKPKYIEDISITAQTDPDGFKRELGRVLTQHWAKQTWSKIMCDEISTIGGLKSDLRRSAWWCAFLKSPMRTICDSTRHAYFEFMRRSRRQPASFLAVLGPDGVGKTTFIRELRKRLADLQVKNEEAIQIEHFRPHLFPNIHELLTGKSEVIKDVNNPHSGVPAGMFSSFLRILYYSIDYILGYWFRLRRLMTKGQTFVFDRYAHDFIVDPHRSRLSLPAWVSDFFVLMIPKPDLVFVLGAHAVDIYRRKQELPPEEIERQLRAYRKLVENEPTRFVLIDASKSTEAMVNIALREIVKRLYIKT